MSPSEGSRNTIRRALTPTVRALRRTAVSVRRPLLHRQLRRLQESAEPLTLDEAARLKRAWGMTSGAEPALLVDIAQRARVSAGPVLECGSGLTTLVASLSAPHGHWSLEQHGPYGAWVQRSLVRSGLGERGRVLHAPLTSYGSFEWYTVADGLPDEPFTLVICDGPPSETPGGRVGLLSVMHDRLAPAATILLDDCARPGEQAILGAWQEQYGVRVEQVTGSRHAVVTMPAIRPP